MNNKPNLKKNNYTQYVIPAIIGVAVGLVMILNIYSTTNYALRILNATAYFLLGDFIVKKYFSAQSSNWYFIAAIAGGVIGMATL